MARPVVASPGAFEGIDAVPGRDLLVADDADAQVEAVLALLDDAASAPPAWARPPARVWSSHYGWDAQLAPLAAMLGLERAEGRRHDRARHPRACGRAVALAHPSRRALALAAAVILALFARDAVAHGRDLVVELDLQPLPADRADHLLAGRAAPRRARPAHARRLVAGPAARRRRRARLAARRGGRHRLRAPSRPRPDAAGRGDRLPRQGGGARPRFPALLRLVPGPGRRGAGAGDADADRAR